jgi:hypothetical protein
VQTHLTAVVGELMGEVHHLNALVPTKDATLENVASQMDTSKYLAAEALN